MGVNFGIFDNTNVFHAFYRYQLQRSVLERSVLTPLKKGNLILTGAYGFPVPINDKKIIEATSSAFGDALAIFN